MNVLTLPIDHAHTIRSFTLKVSRDDRQAGAYGLTLQETFGTDPARSLARVAAALNAKTARHILDRAVTAVTESGHRPSVLSIERSQPIALSEAAGVRLALTMLAVAPLRALDTTHRVAAGIAALSVEETFYWYSLCSGEHATAGRKALRVLLSEA